ncbi:MAG: 50S ribosomal protein L39e [Nitrospiraceae bacterium]|nr:50S ribosomal protein L39e [Nitrospiraceae bacterium]
MARVKHINKKLRLAKFHKLTRWAPYWVVPKVYGLGRRVHPGRLTEYKRSWRRNKTKA